MSVPTETLGILIELQLGNEMPVMLIHTVPRSSRENALRAARKAFLGPVPVRQLIFMHSDGYIELWDRSILAEKGITV